MENVIDANAVETTPENSQKRDWKNTAKNLVGITSLAAAFIAGVALVKVVTHEHQETQTVEEQ